MHKTIFLKSSAILAGIAIALGALGAHALKKIVPPENIAIYETGVRYQFYHAIAIALAAILYKEYTNKLIMAAAQLFMLGILFFSGSLYILTFKENISALLLKFIGPLTPIGGILFMAGWLCLFFGYKKQYKY